MVTLALLDSQQKTPLRHWRFESATIIRVGRSPENDVVLDNPLVSRQHLELHKIDSSEAALRAGIKPPPVKWQIIGMGTNGTFLNGTKVSQGWVTESCLIQLAKGGPILQFQLDEAPGAVTPGVPVSGGLQAIASSCTHAGNPPNSLFCIHCGQPIQVERTIRYYQVLRTLGQGGMGTTYLACRSTPKGSRPQILVLKEMNADMTRIPKAQELFEREAKVLETLNHPGIPKFFDFFVEGGKKYLAMEMIHGQDLEKRVYQRGPVVMQQAIAWMMQTCEVLEYIHTQDPPIVHRDIKPANLMVRTVDNRIVVLDFGAVKEIGTPLGTRIGAPDYTAPEQNRGEPLTQSDLYAVGATLIFLLSGATPQKFYQRRGQGYGFNLEGDPRVTPKLRAVIEKVTEPRPSDRYLNARELFHALADCL